MRFIYILILLTLLTSCASVSPQKAQQHLKQTKSCCQSFSDFTFETTTLNQHTEYELAKASAFNFSQGKSYFIALERPVNSHFIEITSWLNGVFITNTNLIYPLVTVLDQNKQKISTLRSLEDWRTGLSITPHTTRAPFYRFRLTLPENAHYLIVHADPSKLNETTPYIHNPPAGSIMHVNIGFTVAGNLTVGFN